MGHSYQNDIEMARHIRFIVSQRIPGHSREVGLFTAAYYLLREGDLTANDYRWLEQWLAWFESELAVPPQGTIPAGAIFWYRNAGPFSKRMWALARLLDHYGLTTELVTGQFIGRIVYTDRHQVAAIAPTRRHR